jgi:purine-cytosine permease-like protein
VGAVAAVGAVGAVAAGDDPLVAAVVEPEAGLRVAAVVVLSPGSWPDTSTTAITSHVARNNATAPETARRRSRRALSRRFWRAACPSADRGMG